jgi:hypothetical protein
MINYIIIFLIIAIVSWREWQILVDRGSWKKEGTWLPFWYIHWESFWSKFDSFHFLNGLSTLLWMELLVINDILPMFFTVESFWNIVLQQVHVALYWYVWMQIRNLFLHKIYKKG